MESTENLFRFHFHALGQVMPTDVDWCGPRLFNFRDSWPQRGMWTGLIIMTNPLTQNGAQMVLAERDHEIQTLPPHRPDQALAVGIGLRCPDRSSQNLQSHVLNRLIDLT